MTTRHVPGEGSNTRTIVGDAYPPFRRGVRLALGTGLDVVAEVGTLAELAQAAALPDVAVVVLGDTLFRSPAAAVAALPPAARFVVLAEVAAPDAIVRALDLGASGYLLRSVGAAELASTLRAVMRGQETLQPAVAAAAAAQLERRARRSAVVALRDGRKIRLSMRERQIGRYLADGASTKTIAADLDVSAVTVRRQISILVEKLGVSDRRAAAHAFSA